MEFPRILTEYPEKYCVEIFHTVGTKLYDPQIPGNVFDIESLK